ncbi:hypothetical protein CERSUDRAFT_113080 [Gelatoporia subvermispora B]|uniref:DUF1776-domain-containing protein n=1 Tax=Ceriporiopsis subvermispora (strain B) TaxID=914234 RepID=M2QLQ5_CERS8|nr:hypothetical protein CERSUDRAFT_113080 [Gelatoporia subvermispora B]
MPTVVPTIEQIEDYLQSLEELIYSSLSAATPDMPRVSEAIQRLWEDVLRFGPQSLPSLNDIHIPGLGTFEVPPPPPPPPPPRTFWDKSADWVAEHPWRTAGIGIGIVGASLLVGYGSIKFVNSTRAKKVKLTSSGETKQVIIVLGGDVASGLPLILELEKKGYIVIASVSTPEAADKIEQACNGYVRALVLDPSEPDTIPYFLRSLSSTLSRRFPITAAGDPHVSPSSHPHVHSIICLLPLLPPAAPPSPLEHLPAHDYAAHLQATHITPFQLFQTLLPLLRASPARARDAVSQGKGKKSIVVCLPAIAARVGVPFCGAQAMSAAATLRGVEVLRREIRMAALSDSTGSLRNIKVITVDVGSVGDVGPEVTRGADPASLMQEWTPGEAAAYGTAFVSAVQAAQHGVHRKPTDASVFVQTLVDIVSNGQKSNVTSVAAVLKLGLGRLREYVFGSRVVVGAGAGTYALASYLPPLILDALLNLPHFLSTLRNGFLLVPPRAIPSQPLPPVQPASTAQPTAPQGEKSAQQPEELPRVSDGEQEHEQLSETGSDADVESNSGYGSGVGESWVSLSGRASGREQSPAAVPRA